MKNKKEMKAEQNKGIKTEDNKGIKIKKLIKR